MSLSWEVVLIVTCFVTALGFQPVQNFNLSNLLGSWRISSYYDFAGNNNEMICQEVNFSRNNSKSLNYEFTEFIIDPNEWDNHTINIEISSNSAIFLYAGMTFVVSNYSNVGGEETLILAANWTNDYYIAQYFVYAFSRNTEAVVDLREYMMSYGLDAYYNFNYFVINQGCYSNGVQGVNNFEPSLLSRKWNVLAMYDIAGYYKWSDCSNVTLNIENSTVNVFNMVFVGIQGLTPFTYSSDVYLNPADYSMFWGFDANPRTSLIVTNQLNTENIIIISGDQSLGMFLSANSTQLTNSEELVMKSQLEQLEDYQPSKFYVLNDFIPDFFHPKLDEELKLFMDLFEDEMGVKI